MSLIVFFFLTHSCPIKSNHVFSMNHDINNMTLRCLVNVWCICLFYNCSRKSVVFTTSYNKRKCIPGTWTFEVSFFRRTKCWEMSMKVFNEFIVTRNVKPKSLIKKGSCHILVQKDFFDIAAYFVWKIPVLKSALLIFPFI